MTFYSKYLTCEFINIIQEIYNNTIMHINHTFPTEEKNSSKSLGRILAASCMQNTVLASLSSGVKSGPANLQYITLYLENDTFLFVIQRNKIQSIPKKYCDQNH